MPFTLWTQYQATSDPSVGGGALCRKPAPGQRWCGRYPDHNFEVYYVDAKLGYRVNRNLDLQLNMYNPFDTDYVASINKSGYRYHPGEPLTYADGERPFPESAWGRCAPPLERTPR